MIAPRPASAADEVSYLFTMGAGRVALVRVQHGSPDTTIVGHACDLEHALQARAWLT